MARAIRTILAIAAIAGMLFASPASAWNCGETHIINGRTCTCVCGATMGDIGRVICSDAQPRVIHAPPMHTTVQAPTRMHAQTRRHAPPHHVRTPPPVRGGCPGMVPTACPY